MVSPESWSPLQPTGHSQLGSSLSCPAPVPSPGTGQRLLRGFHGSCPASGCTGPGLLKSAAFGSLGKTWPWQGRPVVSPARCLQELHGSPGTAQGCRHSPGVLAQPRGAVWPKASVPGHPFGSRNPFALLGWCCSHAGLRCPRVLQPHPAAQHGFDWARVGMGSPEEQEGYRARGTETPVWAPMTGVPLARSWAADGHTRFGRRS